MYKATYNESPLSGHSLVNYNGAQIMFAVLEAAGGSVDKDDIKAAATALDIPEGTLAANWGAKFNEAGQNIVARNTISMWTPSTLETVWPEQFKTADYVAPAPTWAERAAMTF